MRRIKRDVDSITAIAMRAAVRVSGKVRARYIEELKTGYKFLARDYIIQQYLPILLNSQLAAHLGGFRRTFLIFRQSPGLARRLAEELQEQSLALSDLALSELSDTLAVLQKKTFLNIDSLQNQYKTQALKILNNVSQVIEEELEKTFKEMLSEGVTVKEAVRRLGDKFDDLGLSPKKPYQLETMFRTQLQMSFAAGRYQAEQHEDIQQILWGYKYITVGDDRVRDSHEILEGTTLPKDDPFWQRFYPPNGWNCRCAVIPLFEEREIVKPPQYNEDGTPISPDKGFDFNPGNVFRAV